MLQDLLESDADPDSIVKYDGECIAFCKPAATHRSRSDFGRKRCEMLMFLAMISTSMKLPSTLDSER